MRNPPEGIWQAGEEWTLREDLRIGTTAGGGPDQFGSVEGITVDETGNIYVLDRQASELRAFAPDGTHRWTAGREGAGPGEMASPIGLITDPNGYLQIADPNNARYAFFTQDGAFYRTTARLLGGYSRPWLAGYDTLGALYERRSSAGMIRIDSAGIPTDTAAFPAYERQTFTITTETMSATIAVPFTASQLIAFDRRGYFWIADNGTNRIVQMTLSGDTTRVIDGPAVEPYAVTEEERRAAIANFDAFVSEGGVIDTRRIPDTKPYFTRFYVASDGHVWLLRPFHASGTTTYFDVLDPSGRYLGPVSTPIDPGSSALVQDDAIYGIATDSLDVDYVVRLRIVRSQGG